MTTEITNSPAIRAGAASDNSHRAQLPTDAPLSIMIEKVAMAGVQPEQLPSHTAAISSGVVAGWTYRKVIATPIGILARGKAARAAPRPVSAPGIRKKIPTNRPSAALRAVAHRSAG